ncbi:MAG: hypothetical protein GY696_15795 [Gammaproteobacteria bacterium]|nr:hypothetical protein [Gammaproteobacteria bacterium]
MEWERQHGFKDEAETSKEENLARARREAATVDHRWTARIVRPNIRSESEKCCIGTEIAESLSDESVQQKVNEEEGSNGNAVQGGIETPSISTPFFGRSPDSIEKGPDSVADYPGEVKISPIQLQDFKIDHGKSLDSTSQSTDESGRGNEAVEFQENPCQESQNYQEDYRITKPRFPAHSFGGERACGKKKNKKSKRKRSRLQSPCILQKPWHRKSVKKRQLKIQMKHWTRFPKRRKSIQHTKSRRKPWGRQRNSSSAMEYQGSDQAIKEQQNRCKTIPRSVRRSRQKAKKKMAGRSRNEGRFRIPTGWKERRKAKLKTSLRSCAMAGRNESGIQHHELLRVRKKTNCPRYMFHGHKGESTKEPFKGHLKP